MSSNLSPNISSLSSLQGQREVRIAHMETLKALGHDPFTPDSRRDYTLAEVKSVFDKYEGQTVTLAGRLKSKRVSGKIAFATVEDESLPEGFQWIFKADTLPDRRMWKLVLEDSDLQKVLLGQKTLDMRPLNPGESDFYGDIKQGDLLVFLNSAGDRRYFFQVSLARVFDNLDQAYAEVDLQAYYGSEVAYALAAEWKTVLATDLGPEYVNRLQTQGLVVLDFIPAQGYAQTGLEALGLTLNHFKELFDEGDYVQATGRLERSRSGEPSLVVTEYRILTKALRPIPQELDYENIEARYLDRVVDYKMNTKDDKQLSVRDMLRLKSRFWQIWREEMLAEGFLEVECPIFEHIPGGADAKPFTTFYESLDQEMYLRISLELPLKKLIAAGFEKVFEIGRIFRNEGVSPQHLQEYTQIEWYWAYSNYYEAMPLTQRIYRKIAKEVLGSLEQVDYYGNHINWGSWCSSEEAQERGWELVDGWPCIPYFEAVRYYSKGRVDFEGKTYEQLLEIAKVEKIEIEPGIGMGNLMDKIYKKVARPYMINPIFLTLQPVDVEPLAKRDPNQPNLVHRWQVVVGTAEMGKCFSELNDPIDQYQRFVDQQAARDAGDQEAQFMNEEYVKAMEYGMPPLSGFGVSERLFSFLLGKNIKECVTFPHVRRQEDPKKSQRTMVAHLVLWDEPNSSLSTKLEIVSHLASSLGAKEGKKLADVEGSATKDGEHIVGGLKHNLSLKQVASSREILDLKRQAEAEGLSVVCLTKEGQVGDVEQTVSLQSKKNAEELVWSGLLIYGKKSKVERLTDNLSSIT